jgi:hypothetical protein
MVQIGPPLATISWTTRPQRREKRLYIDGGVGAAAMEGGIKGLAAEIQYDYFLV